MVGLLDIAPLKKEVDVRGQMISVGGLSANAIVDLMVDNPEVQRAFAGVAQDGGVTPERIMKLGPEIICSIIASGLGFPGDKEQKAVAATLMLGEQFDLIAAIVDVTFPRGIRPFVEKLRKMAIDAGVDVSGWDLDTTSPVPSSE